MAGEEKTEKATPKKRRDERKKGNVFQSKDIITVAQILIIFYGLKLYMPFAYTRLSEFYKRYFLYLDQKTTLTKDFLKQITKDCILTVALVVGPTMFIAMVVGVIASGAQTKFIFAKESLKPKFSKLNPLKGIKRIFSLRSVVELLKSIFKIILITYILYTHIKGIMNNVKSLMSISIEQSIIFIFDSIMVTVIKVILVFGIIAFFDFLYQWWEYEKNLRMTKQEIKEEYKHMEGDPQVKGKIKDKQRQMAMSRMMQAVPTADVIIRNPTHFAIALKYDINKDEVPIVVAKGQDHTALKIIEIAQKHNIPTTQNKQLARELYNIVEPNMQIPIEYFEVIAEILAWVYTLKEKEMER